MERVYNWEKLECTLLGKWIPELGVAEYVVIVTDYGHFKFFQQKNIEDKLDYQEQDENINPKSDAKIQCSTRILHKSIIGTGSKAKLTGLIDALEYLNTSKATWIYTDETYITDPFNLHWMDDWKVRGWKKRDGTDLVHKVMWECLYNLSLSRHLTFHYISKLQCPELMKAEQLLKIYAINDKYHVSRI